MQCIFVLDQTLLGALGIEWGTKYKNPSCQGLTCKWAEKYEWAKHRACQLLRALVENEAGKMM